MVFLPFLTSLRLSLTSADVDECAENRCHEAATCYNTPGSFSCRCQPGYHGDGFYCTSGKWWKTSLKTQGSPCAFPLIFLLAFSWWKLVWGPGGGIFQALDSSSTSWCSLTAHWHASLLESAIHSVAALTHHPIDLLCYMLFKLLRGLLSRSLLYQWASSQHSWWMLWGNLANI